MSIEYTSQENKPNFQPEYDVIWDLVEAQEYYDNLDPFDQWTWGQHKADEISEKLGEKLLRVSMKLGSFSVQIVGHEGFYTYNRPEEPHTVEGYVGYVGTGYIAGQHAFYAGLLETNLKFEDPLTGQPLDAMVLAPIPSVLNYEYMPESS